MQPQYSIFGHKYLLFRIDVKSSVFDFLSFTNISNICILLENFRRWPKR